MTTFDLRIGNALTLLEALADESVDSIVTDPPYELGFMGKGWDASGIAFHVKLWEHALRVLKPGGHCLAFSGTRTYHRMVCAIEDAGFEIRDQMAWVYGQGMPKSRDLGEGWGTGLKPSWEPIVVARKPFDGTIYDSFEATGLGGYNIDACRIALGADAERYGRNCSGDRGHDGTREADGIGATDLRTGGGKASTGRWPANLLHDGSDEVLAHFPSEAGGKGAVTGNEPSAASSGTVTNLRARVASEFIGDTGSAARFFYCGKATAAERDAGLEELPDAILARSNGAQADVARGDTDRTDSFNGVRVRKNIHPTVKPIAVGRWLIRLCTPIGGTTLDLFAGSGSFGVAALLEGFNTILLELDRDEEDKPLGYERIIRGRLAWAMEERKREAIIAAAIARETAFREAQLDLLA